MSKQITDELFRDPLVQDDFFDDFQTLDIAATNGKWAETTDGSAPTLATDGESAILLATSTTDNNEAVIRSNRAWDIHHRDKATLIECRLHWTEANTDGAAVAVGLTSGAAVDSIQDGGLLTTAAGYSGALFFKKESTTAWTVESSIATTKSSNIVKTVVSPNAAAYQTLRIEIRPDSATTALVTFSIDDGGRGHFIPCRDASTGLAITQSIIWTSFVAAHALVAVKCNSTADQVVRVDYFRVSQIKP